jgi:hypothetical protein
MRQVIFGVCVLTAACSGCIPDSPTAPTSATKATAPASQTSALTGTELPFHGTFTGTSVSCFFDGTCPPGTLIITGRKTGEATQLGRFTAITVAEGTFLRPVILRRAAGSSPRRTETACFRPPCSRRIVSSHQMSRTSR